MDIDEHAILLIRGNCGRRNDAYRHACDFVFRHFCRIHPLHIDGELFLPGFRARFVLLVGNRRVGVGHWFGEPLLRFGADGFRDWHDTCHVRGAVGVDEAGIGLRDRGVFLRVGNG